MNHDTEQACGCAQGASNKAIPSVSLGLPGLSRCHRLRRALPQVYIRSIDALAA